MSGLIPALEAITAALRDMESFVNETTHIHQSRRKQLSDKITAAEAAVRAARSATEASFCGPGFAQVGAPSTVHHLPASALCLLP